MMASEHAISLVVLTYNAEPYLKDLFSSIYSQTVKPEIIVLDSESSDGTRAFLAKNGICYVSIAKGEFNHGATRNFGVGLAKHEVIVFMTQDVILDNIDSLSLLIQPLIDSRDVAMSFGRQLPKRDATLLSEFARFNNYPDRSMIKSLGDSERLGIKTCFISNSYAAYKKSVLAELGGFPSHLIMCEDVFAGGRALLKGYNIAYVAEARVYHSHNYTLGQEFKRYFDIGHFYNSESWILKNFSKAEGEGLSYLLKELRYILEKRRLLLIPEFVVRNVLKYTGYMFGKYASLLPIYLRRKFSMHSFYWNSKN